MHHLIASEHLFILTSEFDLTFILRKLFFKNTPDPEAEIVFYFTIASVYRRLITGLSIFVKLVLFKVKSLLGWEK